MDYFVFLDLCRKFKKQFTNDDNHIINSLKLGANEHIKILPGGTFTSVVTTTEEHSVSFGPCIIYRDNNGRVQKRSILVSGEGDGLHGIVQPDFDLHRELETLADHKLHYKGNADKHVNDVTRGL